MLWKLKLNLLSLLKLSGLAVACVTAPYRLWLKQFKHVQPFCLTASIQYWSRWLSWCIAFSSLPVFTLQLQIQEAQTDYLHSDFGKKTQSRTCDVRHRSLFEVQVKCHIWHTCSTTITIFSIFTLIIHHSFQYDKNKVSDWAHWVDVSLWPSSPLFKTSSIFLVVILVSWILISHVFHWKRDRWLL